MKDRDRSGAMSKKYFDHIELTPASRGLDRLRTRFSKPLYALTLVAAMVLLIACANIGSLLLVRGAARAREFAIRLATGAAAGRLLRQLLTETLVIFVLGAGTGFLVAHVAIQTLTGSSPSGGIRSSSTSSTTGAWRRSGRASRWSPACSRDSGRRCGRCGRSRSRP